MNDRGQYRSIRKRLKPAVKETRVVVQLRKKIVGGTWPPGTQLPRRTELERQLDVSPLTLQRAVDRLIDDGFVIAKAGHGTFVAAEPPHLTRYGLVFPNYPGQQDGWVSLYEALNNEAMRLNRFKPDRLAAYYGLENSQRVSERERLIVDVQSHRLAGLIFASPPHNFRGTPMLDEPHMARVAIGSNSGLPVPVVSLDGDGFVDQALDYLASRGRRRIGIIASSLVAPGMFERIRSGLAERQMVCPPQWCHRVHPAAADAARNIAHLLCVAPAQDRIDGLFITDDNLVPHATSGLLAAGMRVPDDLDVVAHANFPWPTDSMVAARRLGYDVRKLIGLCEASIDRQRRGQPVEQNVTVPAVFEDEIPPLSEFSEDFELGR